MDLFYEYWGEDKKYRRVVKRQWNHIQKYMIHWWFAELQKKFHFDEGQKIFLLDDSRFSYFSFELVENVELLVDIVFIRKIIQDLVKKIGIQYRISSPHRTYSIEDVIANGKKHESIIGLTWKISWTLHFVFLNDESVYELRRQFSIKQFNQYKRYPASLFTVNFLKHSIKISSYSMIYIFDDSVKLITAKNWFYDKVFKTDFWQNSLKQIFKDESLLSYLYKNDEEIQSNKILTDSVSQIFEFYIKTLMERISINSNKWTDIILISNLTKNSIFSDIFSKYVTWLIQSNFIPFNQSTHLNTFWKTREADELDILCCFNVVGE